MNKAWRGLWPLTQILHFCPCCHPPSVRTYLWSVTRWKLKDQSNLSHWNVSLWTDAWQTWALNDVSSKLIIHALNLLSRFHEHCDRQENESVLKGKYVAIECYFSWSFFFHCQNHTMMTIVRWVSFWYLLVSSGKGEVSRSQMAIDVEMEQICRL